MKHYTELDLSEIKYSSSKKRNGVEYLNLESAFDIETTSTEIEGRKTAFMYAWMVGVGHDQPVYYGRTWGGFKRFMQDVVEFFDLSTDRRLVVYVHNLGFEFQFIRKHFEWATSFNMDERKPIKMVTSSGIEFRDSYILSGYTLANTAKNLTEHTVRKLVGDLDYSKVRTYKTPLTDKELGYMENDITILTSYINEQLQIYGDMTKMPLTNTGRVRKYVRDQCHYDENNESTSRHKYRKYRELMGRLTLTTKEYYLLKQAFQGGFVHANPNITGEVLDDVTGVDFVSSYPAVMLAEQFPMGKGVETTLTDDKGFDYYIDRYCLLFRVKFTNIRSKVVQENYLSESKCENLEGAVINNGRIYRARNLEAVITDVDWKVINETYEWDDVKVADLIRYPKGYLPKPIIHSILDLYQAKTELKGVEGKHAEYLHAKGMLNSIYGMTVTDIVRANFDYDEEWKTELPVVKDQINGYNSSKGRFLFYPWGVWVTAYARRNLWSGILSFGMDYAYSDTDGIKLTNYDDHVDYINGYNSLNRKKLEYMCKTYKIDTERLAPKTIEGKRVMIGEWDVDGKYDRFKTLGAKRYMVQEGDDIALTVAGVGKRMAKDYMLEQCNGDIDKTFDMFDDELTVPKEYTGKMTHTYIDEPMTFTITDYKGIEAEVTTLSGVHLENVEFSLSMSSKYKMFISNLRRGYLLKGERAVNAKT